MPTTLDNLEDMPEFKTGLWRGPFIKIFSIGGKNRIAEISNYPRAYKDTARHVYTEDIPFVVATSDYNHIDEDGWSYRDFKGEIFSLGDPATHWKGEQLPGSFPMWLESEDLPFTPNPDYHVFPIDKLPGKKNKRTMTDVKIKNGNSFQRPDKHVHNAIKKHVFTDKIIRRRKSGDADKQIIRIKYKRGR